MGRSIRDGGRSIPSEQIAHIRISQSTSLSTSPQWIRAFDKTRGELGSYIYGVGARPFDVWFADNAPDVTTHYVNQETRDTVAKRRDLIFPKRTTPISRALRVFLCHDSTDKPRVRELANRLLSDSFEPWLDEASVLAGQDWKHEIAKALRASDVVIICLTENSINKTGFVQREVSLALELAEERPEGSVFLIPVRFEPCEVPLRLQRWQWVDLFRESGYENLRKSLITLSAQTTSQR